MASSLYQGHSLDYEVVKEPTSTSSADADSIISNTIRQRYKKRKVWAPLSHPERIGVDSILVGVSRFGEIKFFRIAAKNVSHSSCYKIPLKVKSGTSMCTFKYPSDDSCESSSSSASSSSSSTRSQTGEAMYHAIQVQPCQDYKKHFKKEGTGNNNGGGKSRVKLIQQTPGCKEMTVMSSDVEYKLYKYDANMSLVTLVRE